MSKPRIQFNAVIDTNAHSNQIMSGVNSEISGKAIFSVENKMFEQSVSSNYLLNLDILFEDALSRDSLKTLLLNRVNTNASTKNWFLTGTFLSVHTCTHNDTDIKSCSSIGYIEFKK